MIEAFETLVRREFKRLLEYYEIGIDMVIDVAADLSVPGFGYVDLDALIGFTKIYAEEFKSLNAYAAS